jgi:hypothetical protein
MDENRKYFGMTITQIAILAGLAGFTCLLLVVGGWLVLRGGPALVAPAPPQNTSVPQATATLFVVPTSSPTATMTPVPYELLIPQGWVQFKTALVEIWLPKDFKRQKGKASDGSASLGTTELKLSGFPSQTSTHAVIVAISYEPLKGDSLEDHVNQSLAGPSADVRVTERRKVSLNSAEAVRILFETRIESFDGNALVYAFQDGGTVWIVQYVAEINAFYELLDTFEQSARTFRVVH